MSISHQNPRLCWWRQTMKKKTKKTDYDHRVTRRSALTSRHARVRRGFRRERSEGGGAGGVPRAVSVASQWPDSQTSNGDAQKSNRSEPP